MKGTFNQRSRSNLGLRPRKVLRPTPIRFKFVKSEDLSRRDCQRDWLAQKILMPSQLAVIGSGRDLQGRLMAVRTRGGRAAIGAFGFRPISL